MANGVIKLVHASSVCFKLAAAG